MNLLVFSSVSGQIIFLLLFLALLVILIVVIYRYRGLVSRLRKLSLDVEIMSKGNLSHRVILAGRDEAAVLADLVNRLAENIQREREKQQRQIRTHRQLVANISHDLRTPITSIAGYLDAILRGLGDDPERYLRIVSQKTEELIRLIEDLFYLTRLDSGDLRLEFKPVDLGEVLRQCVLGFESEIAKEGISVEIDIPERRCTVLGDDSAVRRIFSNLISNSLRHGTGKTLFGVSLEESNDEYIVNIYDNGKGFAKKATELFVRGTRAGRTGGSGLGLSIAAEFAERLGVTISASSIPYERTVFTLHFKKIEKQGSS